MDRPIENLGSTPPLESIEKSVKRLQGLCAGRKVQAQDEAKAYFEGLRDSLESICTNTIANSENVSAAKLENSYNQINQIFTIVSDVGTKLSVNTKSVAQQVDALNFLVETKKKTFRDL